MLIGNLSGVNELFRLKFLDYDLYKLTLLRCVHELFRLKLLGYDPYKLTLLKCVHELFHLEFHHNGIMV